MTNSQLRKYYVGKFHIQGKNQSEIIDALTEVGCINEATGEPWAQQTISRDVAEITEQLKEKTIEQLVEMKMQKMLSLATIEEAALEKKDFKNALTAIKMSVDLFGLASPIRSEITINTNPTEALMDKLDSYIE